MLQVARKIAPCDRALNLTDGFQGNCYLTIIKLGVIN